MRNLVNVGFEAPLSASGAAGPAVAATEPPVEAACTQTDETAPTIAEDVVKAGKKKQEKCKHKMRIEHKTLGRVRMTFASARGNEEQLQEIASSFAVIPGVQCVMLNPDTGSLGLHYDHKRHAEFSRQFERQCREQIASPSPMSGAQPRCLLRPPPASR